MSARLRPGRKSVQATDLKGDSKLEKVPAWMEGPTFTKRQDRQIDPEYCFKLQRFYETMLEALLEEGPRTREASYLENRAVYFRERRKALLAEG